MIKTASISEAVQLVNKPVLAEINAGRIISAPTQDNDISASCRGGVPPPVSEST